MNASSYSIFLLSLRSKLHHHDLSLSCDLSQEVSAGSVSRRVQALANREQANKKLDFFVPYTILPLDHGGIRQAIMQLNEIKAAIAVVRNEGNVANQREHLILLLANIHIRKANKQSVLKVF